MRGWMFSAPGVAMKQRDVAASARARAIRWPSAKPDVVQVLADVGQPVRAGVGRGAVGVVGDDRDARCQRLVDRGLEGVLVDDGERDPVRLRADRGVRGVDHLGRRSAFCRPVHWYAQLSSAQASWTPYWVGMKNGLVVTWLTNTNFHLGWLGKLPLLPPAAAPSALSMPVSAGSGQAGAAHGGDAPQQAGAVEPAGSFGSFVDRRNASNHVLLLMSLGECQRAAGRVGRPAARVCGSRHVGEGGVPCATRRR